MAATNCRRCGNPVTQKKKALCNSCLAENKRVDRKADPSIKQEDQARYRKKKLNPEFKKKNSDAANAWNKKNRDRINENRRKRGGK